MIQRMKNTPVRQVLAENLEYLMKHASDPELRVQKRLGKRAGVAQTSISQMLRVNNDAAKSPKLTQVEKVAGAFKLACWQILLDRKAIGAGMTNMLMRPVPDDSRLEEHGWSAADKNGGEQHAKPPKSKSS